MILDATKPGLEIIPWQSVKDSYQYYSNKGLTILMLQSTWPGPLNSFLANLAVLFQGGYQFLMVVFIYIHVVLREKIVLCSAKLAHLQAYSKHVWSTETVNVETNPKILLPLISWRIWNNASHDKKQKMKN